MLVAKGLLVPSNWPRVLYAAPWQSEVYESSDTSEGAFIRCMQFLQGQVF